MIKKISDPQNPENYVAFLPIEKLYVDMSYQRDRKNLKGASDKTVKDISKDWRPGSAGCLTVSARNGRFNIIDGQGRFLAAKETGEIKHLPCYVIATNGKRDQEAKTFLDINTVRKNVSPSQKFKARIVAKDYSALRLNDLLKRSGYRVENYGGRHVIACINTLYKKFTKDENLFKKIWPLCLEIHGGEGIVSDIFLGLFCAEQKLNDVGVSLYDSKNKSKILSLGYIGIKEVVTLSRFQKGGALNSAFMSARCIVDYLNKNRQEKNHYYISK